MADLPDLSELRMKTDQARLDFLEADLGLCNTFASLVTTELELGDLEGARSAWMQADSGYYTMERFVSHVPDLAEREAIERRLQQLRNRLDDLEPRVRPRSHPYDD
jgi:hypothetical protein